MLATPQALDVGRDLLQSFAPLKAVHEHVCAWHFYAHDMGRQVEVHHYCSHPSEEFRQCCLFDSDQRGARLIGLEYIISERLFRELPEQEKKYWHSHRYEVGSGLLVAPRVPGLAERQDMQKLIGTYGKTWHTWQVDRGDPLPYGPPQLMMAFTGEGQVLPELVAERDARCGISTAEKGKERREKLEWPPSPDPAADHWQSGTAWQTTMEQVAFKGPANRQPA
ncbi:hypothetical protein ABPG77_001642 [Micractinium sp. CCAP 211/92]